MKRTLAFVALGAWSTQALAEPGTSAEAATPAPPSATEAAGDAPPASSEPAATGAPEEASKAPPEAPSAPTTSVVASRPPAPEPAAPEPVRDAPRPAPDAGTVHSRVALGVASTFVHHGDTGFALASTSALARTTGAFVGYAIIDERLSIVPELGAQFGSDDRSGLFGGAIAHTSLDSRLLFGGVQVRFGLLSFLEPEVRLDVGASTLDLKLTPSSGTGELRSAGTSVFASAGAGLALRTPAGAFETRAGALRSLALALTVEGGYLAGPSMDLSPTPSQAVGRIATEDARLGTLDRSGPYFRVDAALRF
jgi:hypothetical protein